MEQFFKKTWTSRKQEQHRGCYRLPNACFFVHFVDRLLIQACLLPPHQAHQFSDNTQNAGERIRYSSRKLNQLFLRFVILLQKTSNSKTMRKSQKIDCDNLQCLILMTYEINYASSKCTKYLGSVVWSQRYVHLTQGSVCR